MTDNLNCNQNIMPKPDPKVINASKSSSNGDKYKPPPISIISAAPDCIDHGNEVSLAYKTACLFTSRHISPP